jgi:hypothetical protein
MGFLKNLGKLFTRQSFADSSGYFIYARCNRCGEIIEARINLFNDLSAEYDDNGRVESYYCRKILVGSQRCYQPIEIGLKFNEKRELVDQTITGGKFVESLTSAAAEDAAQKTE